MPIESMKQRVEQVAALMAIWGSLKSPATRDFQQTEELFFGQTKLVGTQFRQKEQKTEVKRRVNPLEKWKQKCRRHVDNLNHFTGFYKGTYYINGVAQK